MRPGRGAVLRGPLAPRGGLPLIVFLLHGRPAALALACATTLVAGSPAVRAAPETAHAETIGVRHRVTAAVMPWRPPGATATSRHRADLTMRLRISDHAIDARFYGVVGAEWPDLDLVQGAGEKTVWEDPKCHRERGLPKVSVLTLDARAQDGSEPITAIVRQRGMRLPADEIVERKVLGPLVPPAAMAIDAETKATGLRVRVTLFAAACPL